MNTEAIKKEMLERIPELKRIKENPNHDPNISGWNYGVFKGVEQKILDFFDELIDELFELQ